MLSAWEKLTGGLCNVPFEDKPKKKPTARQLKESLRGAVQAAERRFDKLAALDAEGTPESRKARRKMSDHWTNRSRTNPGDLYNRAAARAAKRAPVTITRGL